MWLFSILLFFYCLKLIGYCMLPAERKTGGRESAETGDVIRAPPSVDILLPMYNEEKVILGTVSNLLNISYGNFSIIIIDDGSTDQSYELVRAHFEGHPRVRLIHQLNKGKSAALNNGLTFSRSDIVVCIDADTLVKPDAIDKIIPYFDVPETAAVAGYIKVGNRVNFVTEMQYVEYISVQNFDRMLFAPFNGVLVVPGALGAFRRSAVLAVGGFEQDTVAEDCDITIRLLCKGFTIENAPEAIAYTEAPSTLGTFIRQRVRWTIGLIQGLSKHRRQLARHRNQYLSYLIVPFTWIYRIALPFLSGWLDYYFICALFLPGSLQKAGYCLLFIAGEAAVNYFILRRSGESAGFMKLIFLQRILRHMTVLVWFSMLLRWFNGTLHGWNKIPRKGEVKLD